MSEHANIAGNSGCGIASTGGFFCAAAFSLLCIAAVIDVRLFLSLLFLIDAVCILTLIAYRFPCLIIFLVFFLGQVLDQEAQQLLPEALRQQVVGLLKLRYFDPILLGMILAICLKAVEGSKSLYRFLFRDFFFWFFFVAWLVFAVARSFGAYPVVNILGECRTYYQYLFFIPYIVVFFQTEDEQWRLFKMLIALSSLFLFTGIVKGWMQFDFTIGFGWFSSYANIALQNGMIALYLGINNGVLKVSKRLAILFFVASLSMTIIMGGRSNWLALAVAFLVLISLKQLSIKYFVFSLAIIGVASIVVLYVFQLKGIDIALYFDDRMTAFLDFRNDGTANWRYVLWLESLEKIMETPVVGQGFGRHFQFVSFDEVITTSPHNLYITMAYHLGTIGLMLYAAFVLQIFWRVRNILRCSVDSKRRTMIMAALVILISNSAYYVAFVFGACEWLPIGVGISVVSNMSYYSKNEL